MDVARVLPSGTFACCESKVPALGREHGVMEKVLGLVRCYLRSADDNVEDGRRDAALTNK